jgi:hypothetical protein
MTNIGTQGLAQAHGLYQAALTQAHFGAGVAVEAAAPIIAFTKAFF